MFLRKRVQPAVGRGLGGAGGNEDGEGEEGRNWNDYGRGDSRTPSPSEPGVYNDGRSKSTSHNRGGQSDELFDAFRDSTLEELRDEVSGNYKDGRGMMSRAMAEAFMKENNEHEEGRGR